ncbi:hypothetical protein ASPWEDRAFT_60847 [Aspergillus wentii DTO 134E9]|uniref:Cytochrome P450 monooxygenase n=1 Tax=Aspergillus wentii DTO 134E9 TaxID=1073089 RepID=A0A1L9RHZ7_ASPWE|nr:uncharacterized protein ASPWEDRAFT_60847 [Aspergillus wentii DTO 134E9]OJJ34477.1 hypothetical protein ASPWEDRAFT_60847 [Aspergillus wentii DTO 134E9]
MNWLTFALSLLGLLTLHYVISFLKNLRLVRQTGLPYTIFPISEFNLPFLALFATKWVPYIVNNYLPAQLADRINDNNINYRWTVKDRQVEKLGGVYMVASPETISCNVSDASVVSQVYGMRGSFPKPIWQYESLDLYGPNVLTCEDTKWSHHRRHTAPSFNEKNNALVWQETIRQTTEMIEYWVETNPAEQFTVENVKIDILKLTLNVICGAGFGVQMPFKPVSQTPVDDGERSIFRDSSTPPSGFKYTFRSVMGYMSENLFSVVGANMLAPKWIPRFLMPFFNNDFAAHRDLGVYLQRLMTTAKQKPDTGVANLLQGMVSSKAEGSSSSAKGGSLSDLEILGNMHVLTVAGHETTATTMRFALVLLALHQDVQDWVYRSVKEVVGESPAEWDYATLYPKLIAPLCVMLETLRLYPPVVTTPKWTANTSCTITYLDQQYTLPPKVNINLNANGLHYSKEYWGPDAHLFNPQRWDKTNQASYLAQNDSLSGLSGPGLEYPTIHRPVRGAYIPFSDGFRACVGKKFAQVEFVAALAVLVMGYKIGLAGDDEKKTRRNAKRVLEESATVLTLMMGEDVPLSFCKR